MPPIKPSEVLAKHAAEIPEAVYEAFNEQISRKWDGYQCVVLLTEVADAIRQKLREHAHLPWSVDNSTMISRGWLNIEEAYRSAGWEVEFQKPDPGDSGPACFVFRPKPDPRGKAL